MGFLGNVSHQITQHLRHRKKNAALRAALSADCARKQPALRAAEDRLRAGDPLPVPIHAPLPVFQSPEGSMRWGEEWVFPSADLLMYWNTVRSYAGADEFPMYWDRAWPATPDGTVPPLWQGHLLLYLETAGHTLPVAISLTPQPKAEPRVQTSLLKPDAKKAGYGPWKWEREYLTHFQEPHHQLGQRVWRLHGDPKTSQVEMRAHLVVVALKNGVRVADDDEAAALAWIEKSIARGLPSCVNERQQWVKELFPEVLQRVIARFDLPPTRCALQTFIWRTAFGLLHNALNKERSGRHEPFRDSETGENVYPPQWVAHRHTVDVSTVYRWMGMHGYTDMNGRKGLSEAQLTAFSEAREMGKRQTKPRQALMDYLTQQKGKAPATAKKWIQRRLKRGESMEGIAQEAMRLPDSTAVNGL